MMKMDKEMQDFRDNIDCWVKEMQKDFSEFSVLPAIVGENLDQIQKHEETILDLRQEIRDLKQELQVIKLLQAKELFQKIKQ